MKLKSINPKNDVLIKSWNSYSYKKVNHIISKAAQAQSSWQDVNIDFKISLVQQLSYVLNDKAKEFSLFMADEIGKPLSQGKLEIEKCVWLCNYYLQNAKNFLSKKHIVTDYHKSYVVYKPIGLALGIMPWNFPFWQVMRFAIPSLIVGNGVLLKHASNVQICANAIQECFTEAGFPDGIYNNLMIPSSMVANVIKNNNVSGVAFTGSTKVGRLVAKLCGDSIKKTVLELGGNDPYVILDDANIDLSVKACSEGRILNNGQSCISPKRIIVTRNNVDLFTDKIIKELDLKVIGDPHDEVDLGPMVSLEARDEIHKLVEDSVKMGAKLIKGGKILNSNGGAYYPITILTGVKPGMPAFDDEIFGPVFSIIKAKNDNDAIRLANESKFGLGAAVFTSDIERGEKIASEKIQTGLCFVNDYVKSDPRLPFGGVKSSGYGRELSSYGLMEFVNIKTVVVHKS